jgi:hypothetical protein
MLALSKVLNPTDFDQLTEELRIVDQHFASAREQHPMRRWEYAMALRAVRYWMDHGNYAHSAGVADIGGAGSPFSEMLDQTTACSVRVIDPIVNMSLAQYLQQAPHLACIVTCLSVLEHVEDLDQFLYHLNCLVAPGGLLFLTMDCWDQNGPDTAHFHWMRKRIFSLDDWRDLAHARHRFEDVGPQHPLDDFSLLGEAEDWTYHGNQVYDYTFASLALVKRS